MALSPDYLSLIVYAPPLTEGDDRPLAIIHALEHSLPGLSLGWTTSEKADLIRLPQRDQWVIDNTMDRGLPFLCNEDDDDNLVTLFGLEHPDGPCHQPRFAVHIRLPLNPMVTRSAGDVLAAVADAASATWGDLTPFNAAADIAEQAAPTLAGPPSPPRGLPVLKQPDTFDSSATPDRLGWLNYWSTSAAQTIGFPDVVRDAELISRTQQTSAHNWVVRLTDAPLDLDRPEHLSALLRAYERFPQIGGRAAP
jgi:hypothetical protein